MVRNKTALSAFAERRTALVDYATRIVGSRESAEDIVQEAWLRLDSAGRARTLDHPLAFVYRTVRNLAIDVMRRSNFERQHFSGLPVAGGQPAFTVTPEDTLAHRQEVALVLQALQDLPERTRIAVELYRFHDYRLKDIAAHLGISTSLAHKLVFDGLAHCRERLRRGR